ncbi:MAG: class I SAM-dependent methyltransferase [Patescibacteria group bacterium]
MNGNSLNLWQFCSYAYYKGVKFSIPHQDQYETVCRELELSEGLKILDAGCGAGLLEEKIFTKNIPHLKIEALDFSEKMIHYAKKRIGKMLNVNYVTASLDEKLPYDDNFFDRVVTINVLFAVSNPFLVLKEFHRVLKNSGKIVIVDPKPDANMGKTVVAHFKAVNERMKGWKKVKSYFFFINKIAFRFDSPFSESYYGSLGQKR